MLGRVERAVLAVGEIGRVHIGRWGEGGAHLHWWFVGRPAGLPQLASSMPAEIWDEVLPPTPRNIWEENLARVVRAWRRKLDHAGAPGGTPPRWLACAPSPSCATSTATCRRSTPCSPSSRPTRRTRS